MELYFDFKIIPPEWCSSGDLEKYVFVKLEKLIHNNI